MYFLLFYTIHDVLKAEKALKRQGVAFDLVPVPRNLSSDCGSCIRFEGPVGDVVGCLGTDAMDRLFSFDGRDYAEVDRTEKP
jgi:hypothetical protein